MKLHALTEHPIEGSALYGTPPSMSGQLVLVGQLIHRQALVVFRRRQEQPMRVPHKLWEVLDGTMLLFLEKNYVAVALSGSIEMTLAAVDVVC